MPDVASLEELNERIEAAGAADDHRHIGGRLLTVAQHFALEADHLRPLPAEAFDPRVLLSCRVDRKSRVCVRQCFYSVPVRFAGRRLDVLLLSGASVVARHERAQAKGAEVLTLDHYLEVLRLKPGALPGATALARARASGAFSATHDQFWLTARRRLGDADGTRALVERLTGMLSVNGGPSWSTAPRLRSVPVPRRSARPLRTGGTRNAVGPWLARAIRDGKATLFQDGKRQRIRYEHVGHVELFDDPEEWVRADFWAELIYRYGYPEERIAIEVPVPDRVPGDYADLAVCWDDPRTQPYAVIECKRDFTTPADFEQAVEQAVGNGTWSKLRADYVMVVAGSTRRVLDVMRHGVRERTKNVIADLPVAYGEPEEFKFHKGGQFDIQGVAREELISTLRKCHDTLWGGGKLSPPQAFSELCKLIFMKIADELKPRRVGEPYDVQVRTGETPTQLSDRMQKLYNEHRSKSPDILTSELTVGPGTLKLLVEHIQSTSFSATDPDVKGLAFEMFMDSFFKGDFGQYFTPRELIRFAVDMLDVEPTDSVLDPAAGSGGFLLHALERIREKAGVYQTPSTAEHYALWHGFALNNLYGIEINEEIARVAKMNMVLHGRAHERCQCRCASSARGSSQGQQGSGVRVLRPSADQPALRSEGPAGRAPFTRLIRTGQYLLCKGQGQAAEDAVQ